MAQHDLIWDSAAYAKQASKIFNGEFTVDCCQHGAGYPLFLAFTYKFFGENNFGAVRVVQAAIDVFSALFIFLSAKKLFNKQIHWYPFLLYLINPFTSVYTGVILTETLAIFCISAIAYFLISIKEQRQRLIYLGLGLSMGLLTITKISFFYFNVFTILYLVWVTNTHKKLKYFVIFFSIGILAFTSYSIIGNYTRYKVLRILPPYQTSSGLLYLFANYPVGRYPELVVEFGKGLHPKLNEVMGEFYYLYANKPEGLLQYNKKYTHLFWQNLKSSWPIFIKNLVTNMVMIWDKRYLYIYSDPFYPKYSWALRISTLLYFLFFAVGFITYVRKNKGNSLKSPIVIFTISLFAYISIIMAMVTNESRIAIPFYPLLLLWAGYGLSILR